MVEHPEESHSKSRSHDPSNSQGFSEPPVDAPNNASANLASNDNVRPPGVNHSFNFGLLTLYNVMIRVGWIFKTESIIMPAVLDLIGGGGWLRGCLPMLNRFGQSIPPLLASDYVRHRPLKKFMMATTTMLMGSCFLLLSFVWVLTNGAKSWWLPILFLILYAVFFASTGINILIMNTLTGKLIWVVRRGRLALVSTTVGAALAITFAWFLLRSWLAEGSPGFAKIFAFTGVLFVLSGFLVLFLKEKPDENLKPVRGSLELFRLSFVTIVHDRNFRLLAVISGLFGMSITLFPHYQALARGRLELGLTALLPWVIAQNFGAALFSIPVGWMGDRYGYRRVLRGAMFVMLIAPILSLLLARMGASGGPWFVVVFCLLGLTPITMRAFNNYTLEIASSQRHPRYLSTLSLCMAGPAILTSSLIGALIDWVSFEFVFVLVIALLFLGWILTFWLDEPRNESFELSDS